MKIRKLRIQNIASIERAEIEFDRGPLAMDHIFLITGDTGAGKSTVLNAICLALYDKVPALASLNSAENDREGVRTDNTRQLMRKGTAYACVELEFTGKDNRDYLATWEVQRARRKVGGKIQSTQRRLTPLHDNSIILTAKKDIDSEILRVVGLTFDQFTRTTLLAQGQFASFMKAGEADKSDILEKLTGTEIYTRIGRMIYRLCRQKEQEAATLEAEIKGANLLGDELRRQYAETLTSLSPALAATDAAVQVTEKRLQWLRQADNLQRQLDDKRKTCEAANAAIDTDEHRQMAETVKKWDATADIRRLIGEQDDIEKNLERLDRKLSDLAFARRHRILDGLQWLAEEQTRMAADIADTPKGRLITERDSALAELNEQQKAVKELEDSLAGYDTDALTGALKETTEQLAATISLINTVKEHERLSRLAADTKTALDEAEKHCNDTARALDDARAHCPEAEAAKTRSLAYYHGQMDLKDHIASLRRSFADTGACPLCGTTGVHLHADGVIEAAVESAKKVYEEAAAALEAIEKAITTHTAALKVHRRDMASLQKTAKATAEAISNLEAAAGPAPYPDASQLEQRKKQLENASSEISARLTAANETAKALTAVRKLLDRRKICYDNAEKAIALKRQEIDAQARRIARCHEDLDAFALRFADDYTPRATECPDIETAIRNLSAEINTLDGEIAALRRKQQEIAPALEDRIAASAISRPDIEALALIGEKAVAIYREKITAAEETLKKAVYEANTIDAQLHSHNASRPEMDEADTPDSLETRKAELTDCRETMVAEKVRLTTLLANDEANIAAQKANMVKLEALRTERNNWAALDKTFGGSEGKLFRKVAQSHVLGILLDNANKYLEMLSGRYRLCCDDGSLTIYVVDANHGNTVRNVGLLSGGESFVVSLALALGLSAISKEKISVDTLFIDEGFGTLDSNTLDTVMTVLDRLHEEGGRRIGIISHVPELKERIPTQILLVRTGPSSSCVEVRSL